MTATKETHARRTAVGKAQNLKRIVFKKWDDAAKVALEVRVNWCDAFKLLRSGQAYEVTGATFADERGHERAGVSFAKWVRDTRTDLFRIEVGAYSHIAYLEEHDGPSCPCAYEPAQPSICLLHNAALTGSAK